MNLRQNRREHLSQWNGQSLDQVLLSNPNPRNNKHLASMVLGNHRIEHRVVGRPVDARIQQSAHFEVANQREQQAENAMMEIRAMLRSSNGEDTSEARPQVRQFVNNESIFPSPMSRPILRPPSDQSITASQSNLRLGGNLII